MNYANYDCIAGTLIRIKGWQSTVYRISDVIQYEFPNKTIESLK